MNRFYSFFFLLIFSQSAFGQCDSAQGEVRWRYWKDVPLFAWNIEDFYRLDRFPNGPDYVRTLNSLSTPPNYNDRYGSQVRGFLRSETGGQVVFNVNGDDEVYFNLSTDNTPDNLVLINGDTSNIASLDTITLVANQYYYFELNHFELAGQDYATVEWKGDFLTGGISSDLWLTVGGDYLYDACDTTCPERGILCDDGNAQTENDQEDGNCNCTGNPTTTNTCVGERGLIETYMYNNLAGTALSVLDTEIDNGTLSDTIVPLEDHFLQLYNLDEGFEPNYGTYVQAYIQVPVTGLYSFNITGSHQNVCYISSDDDPANKTANEMRTYWWAGAYSHDVDYGNNPHDQTVENLLLEADKYYYIEFRNKGAANNYQQFHLFWKTPYQTRDEWLRIPTFYFYDYTCKTVCITAGVSCNDGDPYTANDVWDGNCGCAGTPCVAPDCDDPSTSYIVPDECETTNEVSNRADDAWLSCTPLSDAPNAERNGQHWIQYDFGNAYNLGTTQVWNYNADGAVAAGFQQVVIDYSTDGIHWQELGTYNWDLATGNANYAGFEGPDFSNISARYVLISSLDDPNSCRGISKISFNAVSCPQIEFTTPTIDQSVLETSTISEVKVAVTAGEAAINSVALYLDDTWIAADNSAPYEWSELPDLQNLTNGDYELSAVVMDANGTECELSTQIHALALADFPCETGAIVLDTTEAIVYRTDATITSTGMVETTDQTFYVAEESITLMPGFHAMAGSDFTAKIAACSSSTLDQSAQSRVNNLSATPIGTHEIKLYPNPVVSSFTLEIDAYKAGTLEIQVYDVLGKQINNLTHRKLIDKGLLTVEMPADALIAGLYYCKIKIGSEVFTKSFVRVSGD